MKPLWWQIITRIVDEYFVDGAMDQEEEYNVEKYTKN